MGSLWDPCGIFEGLGPRLTVSDKQVDNVTKLRPANEQRRPNRRSQWDFKESLPLFPPPYTHTLKKYVNGGGRGGVYLQ